MAKSTSNEKTKVTPNNNSNNKKKNKKRKKAIIVNSKKQDGANGNGGDEVKQSKRKLYRGKAKKKTKDEGKTENKGGIKRKITDSQLEGETAASRKKPKLAVVKGKVNTTRKVKEKKKKWIRLKERHDKLGTTCSLSAIMKAKEIWEQLRRHDISKTEKEDLVSKVNELVKSQVYELSLKHDTARIIQCILKFGNKTRRNEIFDKLSDRFLTMSKIKYAKFVIKGLFRYCTPSQRSQLITSFYNHIPNLLRHKESIKIVELAYNEYANAKERTLMLQEFYGPKFGLFKDSNGKNISEILADNPDEKDHMICHMKKSLMPLLDKNLVKHSIVHQAILEFMLHADDTSRSEMIEGLREVGVEMVHTREGAKVNLHCVWHGTAKDRKIYVKSLKNYVVQRSQRRKDIYITAARWNQN